MSLINLLLAVFYSTCVPRPDVPPAAINAAPLVHDYHVSKTNLRYVADRQQLQVEMHLFVDDLEEAMRDVGAPLLDIGTEDEHQDSQRYLEAYLQKHFRVQWNGEALPLTTIGWELEDDMHGMWLYLAAEEVAPPREVTVANGMLTEYYPDQKNIVKLFNGDERLGTMLMSRDKITDRITTKAR
jgi:hypothetical protein